MRIPCECTKCHGAVYFKRVVGERKPPSCLPVLALQLKQSPAGKLAAEKSWDIWQRQVWAKLSYLVSLLDLRLQKPVERKVVRAPFLSCCVKSSHRNSGKAEGGIALSLTGSRSSSFFCSLSPTLCGFCIQYLVDNRLISSLLLLTTELEWGAKKWRGNIIIRLKNWKGLRGKWCI